MRLPNGKETISVKDLRQILDGLSDDLPVDIFVPYNENLTLKADGFYITKVKVHPNSGISFHRVALYLGEGYLF